MTPPADLLAAIREENLNVYRASRQRLHEDVGQEAQIAADYRGRLVYELLQNADDAMVDESSSTNCISFLLTDNELWVANSGRPLNDADVRGLCGISASSKTDIIEKKRATIGHKGMGFKSVLEITESPEVYSLTTSFSFGKKEAIRALDELVQEGVIVAPVSKVPISRFPWPVAEEPSVWASLCIEGMNTGFCFPLRSSLSAQQLRALKETLHGLPAASLLFLKHLSQVKVQIQMDGESTGFSWTVKRERWIGTDWQSVGGYSESGVYRVSLASSDGHIETFIIAHDADISIESHRGGLDEVSWDGVEVSEVSVAVFLKEGRPCAMPSDRRKFHVFLPTTEPCPFHMLVNGAFNSNLSRQEIRIEDDASNYNRFLIGQAAQLFCVTLVPALKAEGAEASDILGLLDRRVQQPGAVCDKAAGQRLYDAMRETIRDILIIPLESGDCVPISAVAVPPLVRESQVGQDIRMLLPREATFNGRFFPVANLCGATFGAVMVDLGAYQLEADEVATVLAAADHERSKLIEHPSGKLYVDPVLTVLERLCRHDYALRQKLAAAVRCLPLFPVGIAENDVVRRIVTKDLSCFYPPRSLKGEVPLKGLCFLMQELCWGDLSTQERNQILKEEMPVWQELFDMREFKFPEVMRASVLPALDLERDEAGRQHERQTLQSLERLAAICQLAGPTPNRNRNSPLPYERLGSNRALLNLSRLDVPCRGDDDAEIVWVPAYQAYFGVDWIGEGSLALVLEAAKSIELEQMPALPKIHFLLGPDSFTGLLSKVSHLDDTVQSGDDADEVGLDEDEDAPLDDDARSRWLEFFNWIGVNRVLRPVHFHDVEERSAGWLKTADLRKPEGWIFRNVPDRLWDPFIKNLRHDLQTLKPERFSLTVPYFYRLHDLEHLAVLLYASESDKEARVARALFGHLAMNWPVLERFSRVVVAQVEEGLVPSMRTKPVRARDDELYEAGGDFWLFRLLRSSFCPTGHGPRRPDQVWLPTQEVQRRFGRRVVKDQTTCLIPTLDLPAAIVGGRNAGFARLLGLRQELSPDSFTIDDGRILLERLRVLYTDHVGLAENLRLSLREVIRPAYRSLFELLSGRERVRETTPGVAALNDASVLAYDGQQGYAFLPAKDVFYLERRDSRDRLQSNEPVWCFVLEAFPAARAPLSQLFGMRVLEESVEWSPTPSEPSLVDEQLATFRSELKVLAPFLLARIGAERADDRLARLDARLMHRFIELVEPVTYLGVCCSLEGKALNAGVLEREAFVSIADGHVKQAFVVWGEREKPWPPTAEEAENLATALCEIFGAGYYEPFLALISSRTDMARERILKRSGVSVDLDETRTLLQEGDEELVSNEFGEPTEVKTAASTGGTPEVTVNPSTTPGRTPQQEEQPRFPLYAPHQITINGQPVFLTGSYCTDQKDKTGKDCNGGRGGVHSGTYGGRTDLVELDDLGMYISMSFERYRLQISGLSLAEIFDGAREEQQSNAFVFDVSTPDRIERARQFSPLFDKTMTLLKKDFGISCEWPGFDILTLDSRLGELYDRLIELKSSGVSARSQGMSWNEWKCAQNSKLRSQFYLYLVGNLRSDLQGATPFIRTIRNPFEQLEAKVVEEKVLRQTIQLAVTMFQKAEHLDLTVTVTDAA